MANLIPQMSSDGALYADRVIEIGGSSVIAQAASQYFDTQGCRFLSFYIHWNYASGGPGAASTWTFRASNRNGGMRLPWAPVAVYGDCSLAGNVVTLANQLTGDAFVVIERSPRFVELTDAYTFSGSGDAYGAAYGTK